MEAAAVDELDHDAGRPQAANRRATARFDPVEQYQRSSSIPQLRDWRQR